MFANQLFQKPTDCQPVFTISVGDLLLKNQIDKYTTNRTNRYFYSEGIRENEKCLCNIFFIFPYIKEVVKTGWSSWHIKAPVLDFDAVTQRITP